jgi:hypothetical protein
MGISIGMCVTICRKCTMPQTYFIENFRTTARNKFITNEPVTPEAIMPTAFLIATVVLELKTWIGMG